MKGLCFVSIPLSPLNLVVILLIFLRTGRLKRQHFRISLLFLLFEAIPYALVFMVKVFKFSLISLATALTVCFSSSFFLLSSVAQTATQAGGKAEQKALISSELVNGIIVAVVSGIVGFLASFIIERIKKKSEPRKQISYSKVLKSGIVGNIEKDIESKISILYKGTPAQNMFYALFDIENTGNQQVKNQEIRFEFTDKSEVLDIFYCPKKIQPEMGLQELSEPNLGKHERKFRIGVIKPKENLGFRFIIQGSENESLDFGFHTRNDDDVNFIKVEDKKVADDIDQVREFLMNCLVAAVLFPLIREIFPGAGSLISLGSLAIFGFFIVPRLEGFIKSTINLMTAASKKPSDIQSEKIGLIVMGGSVNVENVEVSSDKD